MRKAFVTTILILLSLSLLVPSGVSAALDKDESWYQSVCFDPELAPSYKADCKEYVAYLAEKAEEAYKSASVIEQDLEVLRKDLKKVIAERQEYVKQIEEIRARIKTIDSLIAAKVAEIEKQEIAIAEKEAEVAEIDAFVMDLMIYQQDASYFNSYVQFVMEADNLVDLLLRISAIEDISNYNEVMLNKLKILIQELNDIKTQLEQDKAALDDLRAQAKKEESSVNALLQKVLEREKIILQQEAELEAQQNRYYSDINGLQSIADKIALDDIKTTFGWTHPLAPSKYRVSAEAWYYPPSFGSGVHLGVDFAADVGTPIYAAGNGIVIASANACSTVGFLGSSCGYPGSGGGGNQVYLLTNINGSLYVVKYLHMKKDTPVKVGTQVNAGDKIGEVGSSGNSSGAHVHVEIFYVGKGSMSEFVKAWKGDLAFGAGWGLAALNNRCEANGNTAPCRIKPQEIFK